MLTLAEKLESGRATPQEAQLFETTYKHLADQNWRASVPQASDAFNPLGDNLMGALGILGFGATGGLAAGALAGGGLGLAGTLGAGGTLAGTAGTGASVLGGALHEPGLQRAGLYLGALGGLAGGAGSLANLWGTGVQNLTDAARLASGAGRITGAVGSASRNPELQQAGRYLGQAGQIGQVGSGVLPESVTDWSTQRGSPMDWDYWGSGDYPGDEVWAGGSPTFNEGGGWNYFNSPAYQQFTGWGEPTGPGTGDYTSGEPGDQNWLQSILGGAGLLGRFLGENANWIGPLASTAGGIASGAIGSNAARNASDAQAAALNRGIDLQTAQWLQQQARTAPWVNAGQQAVGALQGMAGQQGPALPGATSAIDPRAYGMPNATPTWTPQGYQGPAQVNAENYRWNPQAGPRAADYRYTPGQTPDAADYRSGPPQLYQGAMPDTQVSSLTGQQVLDQDPGAAFRQSEARKALEASAAARGGLLSGATGGALQRQSQDLASQEYGNAWQRMMARDTEQYGRNWGQYQQNWNQGVQATQLGLQTNAQNFNQAEAASRLREQVNQIASQQGWNQAQAEAVFREEMAGRSQAQNWTQALQGQQTGWNQGLEAQKWMQAQNQLASDQLYNRNWDQYKATIGMDQAANQTNYDRQQQQYRQRLAQFLLPWEQQMGLATMGSNMAGQVGNQGQAYASGISRLLEMLGISQGQGSLGGANAWIGALGNINEGVQDWGQNERRAQFWQSVRRSRNLNA